MNKKDNKIREIVKKHYRKIAVGSKCGCSCGCGDVDNEKISKSIGYSNKDIKSVADANLGLGCGNPLAMSKIKAGDTVLDLGSGAGFDCFLAVKRVGKTGKVIGVDMTQEMIDKAKINAKKYGYKNTKFILGVIEDLPVKDNTIDVIISNCVINLAPDKLKVFKEAFRVLKKGGRIYVSDIVLLKPLAKKLRTNEALIAGCVGGALLKKDYINIAKKAGFKVKVLSEDKQISKRQYQGLPLESLKIEAIK